MKTCPECGSTELFERNDLLSTSHYPILSGLGGFLQFATIRVVLCADCGLIRQYASEEARAKAKTKWARH